MDMSPKLLQSERDLVEAEAELRAIDDSLAFEDIEGFPVGTASCDLERVVAAPPHTTGHQCMPNVSSGLNPEAPAFNQKPTQPDGGVSELTNYIMKKDLLLSRLSKYDDRPERYLVWKTSFRNIARELKVNATEELDLLGRWLGEESSRQATSLRTANCHNEAQALSRIWSRLDERYGSPELVEAALRQRLDSVSKLSAKDGAKLYELPDILAVKGYERYQNSFSYFDSPHGVNQVLQKLPAFMQNKWIDLASRFKREHAVMYPPFTIFVDFVRNMATRCNDPSFMFESNLVGSTKAPTSSSNLGNMKKSNNNVNGSRNQVMVSARKTDITPDYCPLHGKEVKHILKDCRLFQSKSMSDKKDVIKKFGICFKCCKGKHLSKDCKDNIKCERCGSSSHCTTFHIDRGSPEKHGGEQTHQDQGTTVSSKCTQICGSTSFPGKSCGKTVLVKVYPKGRPEEALDMYAIIDEQSNRSLVREFFEHFNYKSESIDYVLSSCGGQVTKCGRRASGYVIESTDGTYRSALPELIECNEIPNSKHGIPTPAVAKAYKYLKEIETFIPNSDAPILLLIGRDLITAHHVLEQRIASGNTPYAQKLRLGWVIIGETCLGAAHQPDLVTVNKTTVLRSGRASYFKPCPYNFEVNYASISDDINLHGNVFRHTKDDEVLGLSQEDKEFIHQMEEEFYKTPEGNWSAPLPLRQHRPRLENNRDQVFKRTENLVKSLQRNHVK
ncbi:uncharacterized protein [Argopecten irradians]|uniref:uncharacterized protein n=1 Tax=Argopecten irradians TaxID=31199 RepID=UPI0037115F6A